MDPLRIGLIGYGEVGRVFTAGLQAGAAWTGAWDLKFADPSRRNEPLAHAAHAGIEACDGVASLCAKTTLVISGEAGFEPFMAAATAAKHDWMAEQSDAGRFAGLGSSPAWQSFADRLLAHRGSAANDDLIE